MRAVHMLEGCTDVAHDALEGLRHVVERAIGEDDRVLEQSVRVDVGKEAWHGELRYAVWNRKL